MDYLYESTHNDVGLIYRLGSIKVHKTDNDNNNLKGVGSSYIQLMLSIAKILCKLIKVKNTTW